MVHVVAEEPHRQHPAADPATAPALFAAHNQAASLTLFIVVPILKW